MGPLFVLGSRADVRPRPPPLELESAQKTPFCSSTNAVVAGLQLAHRPPGVSPSPQLHCRIQKELGNYFPVGSSFRPTNLKGGLKFRRTVPGVSAQEFLCSLCFSLGAGSWPREPRFLSPKGPTLENWLSDSFCHTRIRFWLQAGLFALLSGVWHVWNLICRFPCTRKGMQETADEIYPRLSPLVKQSTDFPRHYLHEISVHTVGEGRLFSMLGMSGGTVLFIADRGRKWIKDVF